MRLFTVGLSPTFGSIQVSGFRLVWSKSLALGASSLRKRYAGSNPATLTIFQGLVAQLVSSCRLIIGWSSVQARPSPPTISDGDITQLARVSALQAECRQSESGCLHQFQRERDSTAEYLPSKEGQVGAAPIVRSIFTSSRTVRPRSTMGARARM